MIAMVALFLGLILLAVGTAEYLADRRRARRRQNALDSFYRELQ